MNILFDINHPAHVHLLRNVYADLKAHGHTLYVTVKEIPAAKELLAHYDIPYISIGNKGDSLAQKSCDQLLYDLRIWKLVKKHHIDIGVGTSVTLAHVSKISRMRSVILDDDDDAVEPLFVKYTHPFADVILSPDSIRRKAKQTVYYPGTHELAYLHPNRFTPDERVLRELGMTPNDPYFIVRFNAFKAHHDAGEKGLSIDARRRLIQLLSQHGRVFITTEREIDAEFRPYQLKLAQEKIHSLIYYATMFVGDSQTMTSEAAVLGTPAVKCNSFAGRLSVPNELEQKYELCYAFLPEEEEAFFGRIEELLATPHLKDEWQKRRERMLHEKIDVTEFLTQFIEKFG